MTLTGVEVHLYHIAEDPVEKLLDERLAHLTSGNAESQGVDALVQDVQGFLVSLGGVIHMDILTDVPCVVILLITTDERELTRQ